MQLIPLFLLASLGSSCHARLSENTYTLLREKKPNIVFILTDDQDTELGSLRAMPKLHKLIAKQGTLFENMFVTTPICCPSRSVIFSGRYVHNNRAYNNSIDGGCSAQFFREKMEPTAFPKLLKDAGYKTFYAGKYLNQYGRETTGGPGYIPPGWDWWAGLIGNSYFYNYRMSVNGTLVKHGTKLNDYMTNVIRSHAREFFKWIDGSTPFFMVLAATAPHVPAPSVPPYENWFSDKEAPRTPHYGKHSPDKHWVVSNLPKQMPEDMVKQIDALYRDRLRSLQSVDDMVEEVYNHLDKSGLLEDTYIIYSSDNGFQLGQFNLPYDKRHLYEFDTKVPLVIRGPNVPKNVKSQKPVLNLDLAPTILNLAGLPIPNYLDGQSIKPLFEQDSSSWRRSFLIEYYGEVDKEQRCQANQGCCLSHCICVDARNNTYSCMRTVTASENTAYCEFDDDVGFVEFYDLQKDRYQLKNAASGLLPAKKREYSKLLKELKACSGMSCREF